MECCSITGTNAHIVLLFPGWNASSLQGNTPLFYPLYPFTHLGGERQYEGIEFYPRTQHHARTAQKFVVNFNETKSLPWAWSVALPVTNGNRVNET